MNEDPVKPNKDNELSGTRHGRHSIRRRTHSRSIAPVIVRLFSTSTREDSNRTSSRRSSTLLMLLPCCFLLACGANTMTSPSPHPTITAPTTSPPTPTPSPTPSAPPGGTPPPQLAGEWHEMIVPVSLGEYLTLAGTTYVLGSATGSISVDGHQIYFYDGPCGQVGLYQWTILGHILHLTPVGDDPCGRMTDLANHSFLRVSS